MKFRDFVLQQSPKQLEQYAKDAGTTVGYIKTHLLYGYKEPRKTSEKLCLPRVKAKSPAKFFNILVYIQS
jgi:hypothetical protein